MGAPNRPMPALVAFKGGQTTVRANTKEPSVGDSYVIVENADFPVRDASILPLADAGSSQHTYAVRFQKGTRIHIQLKLSSQRTVLGGGRHG
jgi:hypothetical protein